MKSMTNQIRIREFRPSDLPKIVEYRMQTAAISFHGERFDEKKARSILLTHARRHPGMIKVAEHEGRQVGFVRFQKRSGPLGRSGHINVIFVEEPYRKHGVGALLLSAAEAHLKKAGIRRITADVTASNQASLDFFEERGYSPRRVVLEKKN